jgi:hypothetical protein
LRLRLEADEVCKELLDNVSAEGFTGTMIVTAYSGSENVSGEITSIAAPKAPIGIE